MKKINYEDSEFVVVDEIKRNNMEGYIVVLDEYVEEYKFNGIDTDNLLVMDYNPHKVYPGGTEVFHIINNETGLLAGYYGLLKEYENI
jgi:hypothetical protein